MIRVTDLLPALAMAPAAVLALVESAHAAIDLGWLNIATTVGFAGLAWYLIVVAWPKQAALHRSEIQEEKAAREQMLDRFAKALDAEHKAFDRNLERIATASEQQARLHRETITLVLPALKLSKEPQEPED